MKDPIELNHIQEARAALEEHDRIHNRLEVGRELKPRTRIALTVLRNLQEARHFVIAEIAVVCTRMAAGGSCPFCGEYAPHDEDCLFQDLIKAAYPLGRGLCGEGREE
jgi:hypothetical protein